MLQDIRFALRMLRKSPGYTAVVIAAMALGIGANTTVFTLVNAVLFRGLPFANADRVMFMESSRLSRNQQRIGLSYPDLEDWRKQNTVFEGIAAFNTENVNLADGGNPPEQYRGSEMSANAFPLIGVQPVLGRNFRPEEEQAGAANVALIGHSVWTTRYGRDPKIAGRTLRLNEETYTIVGVMPEGMKFPMNNDVWRPLKKTPELEKRDRRSLNAFGVLREGRTLSDARAEFDTITRRIEAEYKATNEGVGARIVPYNDQFNGGNIRSVLLALLGAVAFVLLIACANVANLMLAKGMARAKEMAIRTALGASRQRLVRQMLIESVAISLAGGLLGLMLASWGVTAFDKAVATVNKPYWIDFRMDYQVFAYFAAACVGAGIAFGLFPALAVSSADPHEGLKEGGRSGSAGRKTRWLSGALVTAEFALSLVLLAGAGLMIRNFLAMYRLGEGFETTKLMTARLALPRAKYEAAERKIQFYEQLVARLNASPGVTAAAYGSHAPMAGYSGREFEIEGKPRAEGTRAPTAAMVATSSRYFDAVGKKLSRGRDFIESDGLEGREAVMVNHRFAARHFTNEDPLGKRMRFWRDGKPGPWMTVTAIAPDIRQNSPEDGEAEPVVYVPFRQEPLPYGALLARSESVEGLAGVLRAATAAVDPDLPLFRMQTFEENLRQQRWPFQVFGTLFTVFAGFALLLASVGIFAVMAYSVTQRSQEFGVRLALGATPGSVLRLVMRRGLWQLGIGLALGLAIGLGVTRIISGVMVAGITAQDPLTFAVVTAVLLAAGLAACYLPARRAGQIDPVIALRSE